MLTIGEPVPDFELLNQDGEKVRLSDFRGKKVILFAYPKAGTPGCTNQACGFRDELPEIEESNAVVLGISPDSPESQKQWHINKKLNYDLLSDPDHKVLEEWGAWNKKTMFGNTFLGVIRSHWVIDEEGKLLDIQLKVSPKDSVAKAVKALSK